MATIPISSVKVGHIDDVQELRKTQPTIIPQRFVRDKIERPTSLTTVEPSASDIPTINFSKLSSENTDELRTEISQLATACKDWGFFQVVNHGIDLSLLESIEKVAQDFFMLPLAEKQKYPMAPGTIQGGYGQAFVFSEDQKLDWCNTFVLGLEPKFLRCPMLWPTNPEKFSETVEIYSKEVRKLCQNLLKYIAMSLGLEGEIFEKMFGEAVQAIRMNYYPPCSRPDLVLGLSPHSDGSALTVLQQGKNNSVGLQILKDDQWVPVQPIPNALVIIIGDTIEVLTNGIYKSVEHRAVTHKVKDRLSIVTYYAPSLEVEVGPVQELLDENTPCKYRRYNHGEYSEHYITNKLQGKKALEFAKIQSKSLNQGPM
ncbi:protein SRG1-like [Argentina anserina]|uniref:protein SRG1-like n=1 Tax=Argentina anserina TaxID=57926 RepID=UPI00217656F3|nr:protein SRG1-like [Potentilla anserina]